MVPMAIERGDLRNIVWRALEEGVADRTAPARLLTLSTVGLDGSAEARLVILRGSDRDAGQIEIHTDRRSAKVTELARDPRATLLAWLPDAALQVRFRVEIAAREGTEAEWARIPDHARRPYGGTPAPGAPITHPRDHHPSPDQNDFCVLTAIVKSFETLELDPAGHRRAVFRREDGFRGHWIAP